MPFLTAQVRMELQQLPRMLHPHFSSATHCMEAWQQQRKGWEVSKLTVFTPGLRRWAGGGWSPLAAARQ